MDTSIKLTFVESHDNVEVDLSEPLPEGLMTDWLVNQMGQQPECWKGEVGKNMDVRHTPTGLHITVTGMNHMAEAYSHGEMHLCSFRTEFGGDYVGSMFMIEKLNLLLLNYFSEDDFHDAVHFFTVLSPVSVEDLRVKMVELVESVEVCYDLHRCHQTLNAGMSPKDPFQ